MASDLSAFPTLVSSLSEINEISFGPCEVRGRYGKYAYVVVATESGGVDGFVKFTKLKKGSSYFLSLSAEDIDVWANNYAYPDCKLTTPYKGNVNWTVADNTVVKFDNQTGQITALKPGRTTITATAGEMKSTCTIHALYRWPQQWTAKANCDTHLYKAKGVSYEKNKEIAKGKDFIVWGDDGSNDGWAYGNIKGTDYWGYVPISHISTKGTISQYSSLGWTWPVGTPDNENKANFISSPYGRRTAEPTMHKGFDITTGVPGEIAGYDVVSAFRGKVIYIGYSESTGHCVGIQSEKTDPISGEKMVAFYMHLNEIPCVEYGQKVNKGDCLGYVGDTGNSGGYHLHFEVNNKNASIGDGSTARRYYAYLINPLFFFTDYTNNYVIGVESDKREIGNENKIIIDKDCSTVKQFYGAYWYGDDREEK